MEGTLLYRRGGGDHHPAGLLAHLNGVQGYGAEILQESLKTVNRHPVCGAFALCFVFRRSRALRRRHNGSAQRLASVRLVIVKQHRG